ncbi:uncharacterized protein A4U43_C01F22900 [Asparagus officinalis]|uniref:protein-serine/threonine phosphatase n=1 Tax=Asparagus officinalis TaxID=4686 RepID=A0A5P1FVR0_ASPOF|nr:probable protein phosphatase 2C 53 [Asparagus officinalis]ONK80891.1 uncharacterized protein A4U43_C01F22900 [Asparagus officinalis]
MEMSVSIVTPLFKVASSLCDNPVEFARKRLMADAATLLSDPATADSAVEGEIVVAGDDTEVKSIPGSDDEDAASVVSVDSVVAEDLLADIGALSSVSEVKSIVTSVEISDLSSGLVTGQSASTIFDGIRPSVLLKEYVPLWGSVSICGRRPEMEDALAVVPWFHEIPLEMLIGNRLIDGSITSLSSLPAHFFGVYDGHGGAQVANYCQNRVHLALVEEIRILNNGTIGTNESDLKKHWERAFTDCFQKVDDEVGGKANHGSDVPSEPIAPETVGSTAVVALISSSHIVVANCGDSRAVLYRGKQCIPLSDDHKPNRDDEYERIEAAGGKVIQWNGFRVFGVLAMSRSIGDRYLKPWIIPEPEVTITPRAKEDECIVLASDGLWDVMSNEEVCDVARKRILLWHKKNGTTTTTASSSSQRGETADPAAQAAADYLSRLAIQKGSKDNITIIVVDLKAQRKFKSKTNSGS